MIYETLNIEATEKKEKELKKHYREVIRHLEEGFPLKPKVLETLKSRLSGIVNNSKDWRHVLQGIQNSEDDYCVRLMHRDNEILNLPWSMAVDSVTGFSLGQIEKLHLTKSILGCFEGKGGKFLKAPAPLKILVMISAPEDIDLKHRLSYEEEESKILAAVEPLMFSGEVEIDFTEEGSLESLKRKLAANKYHILHFSGHAIFREKDRTGYLQLEDPLSLNTHLTSGKDFAEALNPNPEHIVPIVMLSSCQTAQGSSEEGLRGVTNRLLNRGVPAVISMGMAIIDKYASLFSAYFYRGLAGKQNIFSAFYAAVRHLKETEEKDNRSAPGSREIPLQWIIPNLYLSREIGEMVDWNRPVEKLKFSSQRYIFGQDPMFLPHDKKYRFIGRRKEKSEILRPFFGKAPILLKGQGGVGKTAMAEHLVQRLIAKEPKTVPFLFNESIRSIKEILDKLEAFLTDRGHEHVTANVNQYEKAMAKFQYLLFRVNEDYQPVFVFDNLESFQEEPGKGFSEEYSDIKEVIDFLCDRQICHMLLTCRYPVPGFKNLQSFDLNQVGLTDFWKKCLYLDVGYIRIHLHEKDFMEKVKEGFLARPGLRYIEVVKLLHETFGGNYRALEFFDIALKEKPGQITVSLDSLEKLRQSTAETAGEVKHRMGQNLLFSQLMSLLTPGQQRVLELLSHFRIPVHRIALELQVQNRPGIQPVDFKPVLESLRRLTLIEVTIDREINVFYYYVTPLVKDLLENYTGIDKPYSFSHQQAGIYYYRIYQNIKLDLTVLEEAFYHFYESEGKEKIQELGDILSRFCYESSMYHSAIFYAQQVYNLLGDNTRGVILNRLGLIYQIYGELDRAMEFFKKTLAGYRKSGDERNEGSLLSNISQVYSTRGDYGQALDYLEKSLKICRKIGDKKLEGTILNNISQVYSARGDNERALEYLEKSLNIRQEIGDKFGEANDLSNIGSIVFKRGDYDKALKYMEESLEIFRKIGDKKGEGELLNNIGRAYSAKGDSDIALEYLGRSLEISQEIGDKKSEGVSLNNISQIYSARGENNRALNILEKILKIMQKIGNKEEEAGILNNIGFLYKTWKKYDKALVHLEKSLRICRKIGYRAGEGTVLNNISLVYSTRGDYAKALEYLEQDLNICHEMGDKSGTIPTLHNMALIALEKGDIEKFKEYEIEAYSIADKISDAEGIYKVGKKFGSFLFREGVNDDKVKGLAMLKRSYEIGKQAGYPEVVEIEKFLRKIGEL